MLSMPAVEILSYQDVQGQFTVFCAKESSSDLLKQLQVYSYLAIVLPAIRPFNGSKVMDGPNPDGAGLSFKVSCASVSLVRRTIISTVTIRLRAFLASMIRCRLNTLQTLS